MAWHSLDARVRLRIFGEDCKEQALDHTLKEQTNFEFLRHFICTSLRVVPLRDRLSCDMDCFRLFKMPILFTVVHVIYLLQSSLSPPLRQDLSTVTHLIKTT
jgi:hypothetical protein